MTCPGRSSLTPGHVGCPMHCDRHSTHVLSRDFCSRRRRILLRIIHLRVSMKPYIDVPGSSEYRRSRGQALYLLLAFSVSQTSTHSAMVAARRLGDLVDAIALYIKKHGLYRAYGTRSLTIDCIRPITKYRRSTHYDHRFTHNLTYPNAKHRTYLHAYIQNSVSMPR